MSKHSFFTMQIFLFMLHSAEKKKVYNLLPILTVRDVET